MDENKDQYSSRENLTDLFIIGLSLIEIGKYEEALEAFDKVIWSAPNYKFPNAWFNKGSCLYRLGRYQEAAESYEIAIKNAVDGKFSDASGNLGVIFKKLKRYEEAIETFNKAIKDSPNEIYPEASYMKGKVLEQLEKYAEAIEAYEEAIQKSFDEKFPKAFQGKAICQIKLRKYDKAIENFDKAVRDSVNEKFPEASYNKGLCLTELGRYEEANKAYKKAIKDSVEERFPPASNNIGTNLARLGRYEEAIQEFNKAIHDAPEGFPLAWLNKARSFFNLNKTNEAIRAAFQAVKLDNTLKPVIFFIKERISKEAAYRKRSDYLDIKFVNNVKELANDWKNVETFFLSHRYDNNTDLYCELLLNSKDLLNTGRSYYDRLRLAYLIFASHYKYEWVYYIIDHLLDDGIYQLNYLDYYFYLTAASWIAASKKELEIIIEQSHFHAVNLIQIDEYLFQLSKPLPTNELINHIKNDLEREILLKNYFLKRPYITEFCKNELLLCILTQEFISKTNFHSSLFSSDVYFLNFIDCLKKDQINVNQVAYNIDLFIDGASLEKIEAIIYYLSDESTAEKIDTLEIPQASALLKGFAILKHELKKRNLNEEEVSTIQFFTRGLISTVISDIAGGIISMTFLLSLGLTYAIEFCLNCLQSEIQLSSSFTWEQFNGIIKNKSKELEF